MAPKSLRQQLAAASASASTPTIESCSTSSSNMPVKPRLLKDEVFGNMSKPEKTRPLDGDRLLITFTSLGETKTISKPRRMIIKFSKFAREQLPRPEPKKPDAEAGKTTTTKPAKSRPAELILPHEKVYEDALHRVFAWMEECCRSGKGTLLAPTDDLTLNVRTLQVIQTLGIARCESRFIGAIKAYISKTLMTKKDVAYIWAEFPEDEAMNKHLVYNITYSKLYCSEEWEHCEEVIQFVNSREGLYEMVEEKSVQLKKIKEKSDAWQKREDRRQKIAEDEAKRNEYFAKKEQARRDRLDAARNGLVALTEREVRWGVGR